MTTYSGKWVIDSHIFIYAQDIKSPFYLDSNTLFEQIISGNFEAITAHQNIIEVERVLTKVYKRNLSEIAKLLEDILFNFHFKIIYPISATIKRYHSFLIEVEKPIDLFDYYLAATMLDNDINRILTLNIKDFSKIPGIEAVNPFK